ncbi:MAG: patatin-like phospholipase family protein, partial [Candidatus Hydrogenedentes bacterium]|nr:patatin-like phospholipase family protein [Candidatus Hydrogenedentota bacterium]
MYVDTAAPGSLEGAYTIGLAFSGGGTRGTVFAACCVDLLRRLGEIQIEQQEGRRQLDLWQEVDYVSGVSTGAIPAAAFALNASAQCPGSLAFEYWPDCFNVNLLRAGILGLARRPDRLARDMTLGMNTRPGLSALLSETFFGGSLHKVGSGLTFGDLPSRPVLFLGSTMIQDPSAELIQTRLPYRFAL